MNSNGQRINNGQSWWAPVGAYEACMRTVAGVQTLYARYVGAGT